MNIFTHCGGTWDTPQNTLATHRSTSRRVPRSAGRQQDVLARLVVVRRHRRAQLRARAGLRRRRGLERAHDEPALVVPEALLEPCLGKKETVVEHGAEQASFGGAASPMQAKKYASLDAEDRARR